MLAHKRRFDYRFVICEADITRPMSNLVANGAWNTANIKKVF